MTLADALVPANAEQCELPCSVQRIYGSDDYHAKFAAIDEIYMPSICSNAQVTHVTLDKHHSSGLPANGHYH
jgi:hypothetical protein